MALSGPRIEAKGEMRSCCRHRSSPLSRRW